MIRKISERVAVIALFDPDRGARLPVRMRWGSRYYEFAKVDLYHTLWEGRTLHHIFSVCDGVSFFRLNLDSRSLIWTLEEVSDGLAD